MVLFALLVAVSIAGAFFTSLAEASLYSISRARIETLRRLRHPSGEVLARLRDDIDRPVATLLILNTAFEAGAAAWVGAAAAAAFGEAWIGLVSAGFTLAVIVIGELLPKSLGIKHAHTVAPAVARPLAAVIWAMGPLVRVCVAVTDLFGKHQRLAPVPEDDIISLADMSLKAGGIRSQEARWVVNALHLDKLSARDLMTPALVVWRVAADMPLKMAAPEADMWRFSRIPVYDPADDARIIGVVERRKVFQELVAGGGERTVRELMLEAVFVEDSLPAHALLDMFVKGRKHLFCVKDSAGRWLGIVTLEDVLEALLGLEIVGEQDIHDDMQQAAKDIEHTQALAAELKAAGARMEVVSVERGAPLAGRSLKDAGLPKGVVVGTIVRRGVIVVPHGRTRLVPGDKVTLIGKSDDVERALASLTKPAATTEPMP
ncbi:MAG: DUF21 domain-containing protein [Elusimicrobia bacterium]|nr:DUF21 domain-containing protein [Elusimicrobiota bacterium]